MKKTRDDLSVSVIVPNYNNGKYLNTLVRTVNEQTYPIKEIIIVDDCSTDNSREIIECIKNNFQNVKSVFLSSNRGVSHARNEGFKHSTGSYITFLDADDFYCNPKAIELEMQIIEKSPCDVLAFSYLADSNESGEKIKYVKKNYLSGDVRLKFFKGGMLSHYQLMKRELFSEAGGYPEDVCLYEDLKLLIKLSQKYRFVYTGEFGPVYRHVGGGLSSNRKANQIAWNAIMKEYYSSLSFRDKIIAGFYTICRHGYMVKGELKRCLKYILQKTQIIKKESE